MKEYTCCNKPDFEKAYVWFWPFKAKHCKNCGEVIGDTGRILDFIWQFFIWPFWDGRVKVITTKEKVHDKNFGYSSFMANKR